VRHKLKQDLLLVVSYKAHKLAERLLIILAK